MCVWGGGEGVQGKSEFTYRSTRRQLSNRNVISLSSHASELMCVGMHACVFDCLLLLRASVFVFVLVIVCPTVCACFVLR